MLGRRREAAGAGDGRKDKPISAEAFAPVIADWMEQRRGASRPVNVKEMWEQLEEHHGYSSPSRSRS